MLLNHLCLVLERLYIHLNFWPIKTVGLIDCVCSQRDSSGAHCVNKFKGTCSEPVHPLSKLQIQFFFLFLRKEELVSTRFLSDDQSCPEILISLLWCPSVDPVHPTQLRSELNWYYRFCGGFSEIFQSN